MLTGSFVYKIKKEVKFGNILDFSKLSLRKKFCKKEVLLNRPLCGDMYQSTVKIIQKNVAVRFVELEEKGKPLEYAVKMILFILQLLQYILNNGQPCTRYYLIEIFGMFFVLWYPL